MKTFYLISLLLSFHLLAIAQDYTRETEQKTASFKDGVWGFQYYLNNQQASYNDFKAVLNNSDPQLANMFSQGKNLSTAGTVFGSIGAFCLGWDLGARIAGSKGNTAMLAGGGGVMVGGIIMYYVGKGKMKKALSLYEKGNTSVNVDTSDLGLALKINF